MSLARLRVSRRRLSSTDLIVVSLLVTSSLNIMIGRSGPGSSSSLNEAVPSNVFSFAASGDLGGTGSTSKGLKAAVDAGTDFFLALGDLSYHDTGPEPTDGVTPSPWCSYVKGIVGQNYPFEVVAGNHEDYNGPDGYILNFAGCLPDHMGSQGIYGVNYYFDYPLSSPIARVFMVSVNMWIDGVRYGYGPGSSEANWLSGAIDQAKSRGEWTIVGLHYPCLNVGVFGCNMGNDLMQLLLQKKVDLVLSGHEHNYQRSKQLTCATDGSYRPECVVNDGSSGMYQKGSGTVFTVQGDIGGGGFMWVNRNNSDAGYFASMMGGSQVVEGGPYSATPTPGGGRGFMLYTVTSQSISARWDLTEQTVPGPAYSDKWSIGVCLSNCLRVRFSIDPVEPTAEAPAQLQASAEFGTTPYNYSWTVSGTRGTTATGQFVSLIFSNPGKYDVAVNVRDVNGATGSLMRSVTVKNNPTPPLKGNYTIAQAHQGSTAIMFTGTVYGGFPPYSVSWDFGDGRAGLGIQVQHTYHASGNYSIAMRAADSHRHNVTVRGILNLKIIGTGGSSGSGLSVGSLSSWMDKIMGGLIPMMIVAATVASGVVVLGRSRFGKRVIGRTQIRYQIVDDKTNMFRLG